MTVVSIPTTQYLHLGLAALAHANQLIYTQPYIHIYTHIHVRMYVSMCKVNRDTIIGDFMLPSPYRT